MSRFKMSQSIDNRPTDDPKTIVAAHSPTPLCRTVFRDHPTGFGKQFALVEAYDSNWPERWRLFMLRDDNGLLYHLNGTSEPIRAFWNDRALKLTPKKAAHYLRFFCRFVYGEDGSFFIAETPEQLAEHCGVVADDPKVQAVAHYLRPVKLKDTGTEHLVFKATVFYGDALFRAVFKVMRTGAIEMLSDTPKAQEIGLKEVGLLV